MYKQDTIITSMLWRSCNCISRSRSPPPSQVPFPPALSESVFTTDKTNEVNGTKAQLFHKRFGDNIDVSNFVITGLIRLGMADTALFVFLVNPYLTGLLHAIFRVQHGNDYFR